MTEYIEPATDVACTILGTESVGDDLYAVLQHDEAAAFRGAAAAYTNMQTAEDADASEHTRGGDKQNRPPFRQAKKLLGELIKEYGIKLDSFTGTVIQQPDDLILDNGYLVQEYHSTELTGYSPKLGEIVRVEREADAETAVISPVKDEAEPTTPSHHNV
jgi:hypothetical protein